VGLCTQAEKEAARAQTILQMQMLQLQQGAGPLGGGLWELGQSSRHQAPAVWHSVAAKAVVEVQQLEDDQAGAYEPLTRGFL
jgi:hypothetical protein